MMWPEILEGPPGTPGGEVKYTPENCPLPILRDLASGNVATDSPDCLSAGVSIFQRVLKERGG